jgi:hypothetical protein
MRGKILRMLMNAPSYLAYINGANVLHAEHQKLLMKQAYHNLRSLSESEETRAMNKTRASTAEQLQTQ